MPKRILALLLAASVLLAGFSTASTSGLVYGRVVTDTNGNGAVDPSDVGIAGVNVRLTQGEEVVASGFTDGNGEYELFVEGTGTFTLSASLYTLPGSYTVVIGEVGGGSELNFIEALTVFLPVVGR